jgi:hypothetical protein
VQTPQEKLDEAKAEVARLERLIAAKSCVEGHHWKHVGGRNACCDDRCQCSIPVYECVACGDCDYGENDEAREIVKRCKDGEPNEHS